MADNTMNQGGRQGGSDQGRSGKTGQEGRQESQSVSSPFFSARVS